MAETLGALCDKLTIVKLKQWHSENPEQQQTLALQETQLQAEINAYVTAAVQGEIPAERLVFLSNKVFKQDGNAIAAVEGTLGALISNLAQVNCQLWHEQDKVYRFEEVPMHEKDAVVKQLALLNLERNQYIDQIDLRFKALVENGTHKHWVSKADSTH